MNAREPYSEKAEEVAVTVSLYITNRPTIHRPVLRLSPSDLPKQPKGLLPRGKVWGDLGAAEDMHNLQIRLSQVETHMHQNL